MASAGYSVVEEDSFLFGDVTRLVNDSTRRDRMVNITLWDGAEWPNYGVLDRGSCGTNNLCICVWCANILCGIDSTSYSDIGKNWTLAHTTRSQRTCSQCSPHRLTGMPGILFRPFTHTLGLSSKYHSFSRSWQT